MSNHKIISSAVFMHILAFKQGHKYISFGNLFKHVLYFYDTGLQAQGYFADQVPQSTLMSLPPADIQ